MVTEYARPRPAIEFIVRGEIRVHLSRTREVAKFMKRLDSLIRVESKGDGVIESGSQSRPLSF